MKIFRETLIDPIFDVESIGDGLRVPRAHLEVVLTQLLASPVLALYSRQLKSFFQIGNSRPVFFSYRNPMGLYLSCATGVDVDIKIQVPSRLCKR